MIDSAFLIWLSGPDPFSSCLCKYLWKNHFTNFQISSLLAKYAQHLLDDKKILQAIELYRKANHFLEAARLLMELAKDETKKRSSPLRIKKLYVLGALMVEEHQVIWPCGLFLIYFPHVLAPLPNFYLQFLAEFNLRCLWKFTPSQCSNS